MVSTLDGSATDGQGRSGGVSGPADRAVFSVLRALCDVVLVGAGTVRAEGYRPPRTDPDLTEHRAQAGQAAAPRLAVVTGTGRLPEDTGLLEPGAGTLVVVPAAADVGALRGRLGSEAVVVAGDGRVDPAAAVDALVARGLSKVLLEGGPTLLGATMAAGRLDELCLTLSPLLVAGEGPRIARGDGARLDLRPTHLVESEGLLLGRWLVAPDRH
jgi:riboflavin biosynthesis pyrimidine reductase